MVTKEDYENLSAFRYALRMFLRFSDRAAEAVGLTPQQHQALLAIQGFPGRNYATVGELAERLQIRSHSAVGLVDRLETQGLVSRDQGQTDRRQVYVMLTGRGEQLLEQLSTAHQEELHRIRPLLERLLDGLARKGVSLSELEVDNGRDR
jgi:DNA-binding MarR family transcriptional regulator